MWSASPNAPPALLRQMSCVSSKFSARISTRIQVFLVKSDKDRINTINQTSSDMEKITQSSPNAHIFTAIFEFEYHQRRIPPSSASALSKEDYKKLIDSIQCADQARVALMLKASDLHFPLESGFFVLDRVRCYRSVTANHTRYC